MENPTTPPTRRPTTTPPLSSYFNPSPSPHPWAWVLIPVGIVLLVGLGAFFTHRCHRSRRRRHHGPPPTTAAVVQRQSLDPPAQPGWDTTAVAVPPPVWGWGEARDLEDGLPPPPYSEGMKWGGKKMAGEGVGYGEGSGSGGGGGSGSGSSRGSTSEDGYYSGSERGEEDEGVSSPETMLTTASGSFVEFGVGEDGEVGPGVEEGEGSGSDDVGRDGEESDGDRTGPGTAAALPR